MRAFLERAWDLLSLTILETAAGVTVTGSLPAALALALMPHLTQQLRITRPV